MIITIHTKLWFSETTRCQTQQNELFTAESSCKGYESGIIKAEQRHEPWERVVLGEPQCCNTAVAATRAAIFSAIGRFVW